MGSTLKRTFLILLAFLMAALGVQAQERATSLVVLDVTAATDALGDSFSSIIFDLVAVELEWGGFAVRRSSESAFPEDSHTVTVRYDQEDDDMTFRFQWTDASGSVTYAAIERKIDVSLGMDFVIANAVRQLVSQAGVRALSPTTGSGESADSRIADGGNTDSRPSVGDASSRVPPETEDSSIGTSTTSSRGIEDSNPPQSGTPDGGGSSIGSPPATGIATPNGNRGRFLLDIGGGAFMPVGQASRYFAVAPGASIFLGYQIPAEWLSFGIGSLATRFFAEGAVLSSVGYLGGAGIGLRFGVGDGRGPYIQLGGGAGAMALDNPKTGFIYTIVPFGNGKLGLPVSISESFRLTASVDYSVFFVGRDLWMGISPAMEVSLRL